MIPSRDDAGIVLHRQRHHLDYLYRRYGEPDTGEAAGLAAAASLLASGGLEWQQVEEAIDSGWDPAAQSVLEFLGCPTSSRVSMALPSS